MSLQELQDQRNKAIKIGRDVLDKADAEKRSLTAEENQIIAKAKEDAVRLKTEVENEMRSLKAQADLRNEFTSMEQETRSASKGNPFAAGVGETAAQHRGELETQSADPDDLGATEYRGYTIEHRSLIEARNHAPSGSNPYSYATRQLGGTGHKEYRRKFGQYLRGQIDKGELRTANSFADDVNADGGYLKPPIEFYAYLIKKIDNMTFIRQKATVIPITSSDTLGIPTLVTDLASVTWTSELTPGLTSDATAQFGMRDLKPNILVKEVDVSNKLLRVAVLPPEQIVGDRLAYAFAVALENGYMTGNGTGQPLGMFTASSNGIDTSRDVVIGTALGTAPGVSAGRITFDGLNTQRWSLKAQYRKNASWVFNRTIAADVAGIKDSYGRYILTPSVVAGQPDTIWGYPIMESEYAPNTYAANAYISLFGDLSWYWIADLFGGMEIQRLNELLARTNQVGFLGRQYSDGAPVLAEAFSRGQCSAS